MHDWQWFLLMLGISIVVNVGFTAIAIGQTWEQVTHLQWRVGVLETELRKVSELKEWRGR